jgi:paraquat-inducible protein B
MSMRANPTIIGAFVVGAAALLVAALLVWGGSGFLRNKLDYVAFFDAAVTGLQKGAPVMLRGVRVGEVTDVQVRWGTRLVAVYLSLDPNALKGAPKNEVHAQIAEAVETQGLRAQLKAQSLLTGVLFVALDALPDTPIVLRGLDPKTPELPTVPTDLEMWMAKLERLADAVAALPLQDIATAAAATLNETTRLLKSPEIARVLQNTDALVADTRTLVKRIETLTTTVTAQVDPLAASARGTLRSADTALADLPRLISDVQGLVAKVDVHVDPLLASLRRSSDVAQSTLEQARVTLGGVDGVLSQDSAIGFELGQTLRELRETARALRSLADYLERVPDSVVYGVRRTGDRR